MAYKVLIVDDQLLPRQYFESLVRGSDRYELAASIESASVADVYCAKMAIDLILMDIVMAAGPNGLEAARRIRKSYPNVRIIAVTSMPDAHFLAEARDAGVDSFWYKEVQDAPMLDVMDRTMAGKGVWPDRSPVVPLGETDSSLLTDRELDVLRLLAKGYTNQEIGDALDVSVNTVRFHIGNLLSKTGCGSRTELAITAAKSGIVISDK
ncbi:MAG: response regulator transcription factor [Lachnospiraceae bacterium]|nr:response regulator transcription factor [Lachnospiraceae bacterium]